MTKPIAAGLYEFFTRTGILDRIAGCIEIGCKTWLLLLLLLLLLQ